MRINVSGFISFRVFGFFGVYVEWIFEFLSVYTPWQLRQKSMMEWLQSPVLFRRSTEWKCRQKKKAGVNPDATGAKLNCIDDTAAPPRRKVNARQEHDLHYVENLHPYNWDSTAVLSGQKFDSVITDMLRNFPHTGCKRMTGFLSAIGLTIQQSRIRKHEIIQLNQS